MGFAEWEKLFDKYSTKEELEAYLKEQKSTKIDSFLKGYDIYKFARRQWEGLKFENKKDLITIRNKSNIEEIIDIIISIIPSIIINRKGFKKLTSAIYLSVVSVNEIKTE